MTCRCLAQQPEVAIGRFEQLFLADLRSAPDRFVDRSAPGESSPGLDHLANEVHATVDRLQDGFRRVYLQMKILRQPCFDVGLGCVQPLRILMQQDEVVDVADIVTATELMLDMLVKRIEEHVGEKLATQVTDRQSELRGLVDEALMRRHAIDHVDVATVLVIFPGIVEEHLVGKPHPPGIRNALGEQLADDVLVNADEEIRQVHFQVEGALIPVLGNAPDLRLEAFGAVKCPSSRDARAAIGDERGIERRRDSLVEQMMDDPIAKLCRPYLARLRPGDDEANAFSWVIRAVQKLFVQLDEIALKILFESERTVGIAFVASAVSVCLCQQFD